MENVIISDDIKLIKQIINEIKLSVKGKDDIIYLTLLSILSKGHILLEDMPGVGKTTLATAFSDVFNLKYNRVQFTPDVLPSDITGFSIYKKEKEAFEYVKGAALCNLFLADEINRTSPKTQSALLEVMEEGFVTVDLVRHEVPNPFTVIATQNPYGYAGTQLLPESQLDRFLVRLSMGYPDTQSEIDILKTRTVTSENVTLNQVATTEDLINLQNEVANIFISDEIYSYIVAIIEKTRQSPLLELGASPRGSLAICKMAKANAFCRGRSYVTPKDAIEVIFPTISHRLILNGKAKASNISTDKVLEGCIKEVQIPNIK